MKKFALALVLAFGLSVAGTALAATHSPQPEGKAFVTGVLSGVEVDNLATGKQIKHLDTGLVPHNLLVSKDGKRVYVTNVGSQSVSEIDVATLRKIKDILIGPIPRNKYHDKLGPKAFAGVTSCYGCHSQTAVGSEPVNLAWAADGKTLLVTEARGHAVALVDTHAGKVLREVRTALPIPNIPSAVAVDPVSHDNWVLYSFNPPDFKQGTGHTIKTALMDQNFSHLPALGQHDSFVVVYDAGMRHELKRLRMPWANPFGTAFSPDGRWLYVSYRSSNKIAVFDRHTLKLARTFDVGISPVGIALSPDGRWLYVSCLFAHPAIEQVVDTRTGAIKVSMGVPPSPSRVAVDPRTGYLYVTATGTNKLLEIDPVKEQLLRMLPAGSQPLDCVLTR